MSDPNAARFEMREGDFFIITKFSGVLKYDPDQPRDKQGQWSKTTGRSFTSDEGYEFHEKGPGAKWAKAMPYEDQRALSGYAGFGYHDINDLRRGTYKPPIKAHFVRASSKEEHEASTMTVDEEYLKHAPHPFSRQPYERTPDEPYERVLDAQGNYVGHIEVNQFYTSPTGEKMMYSVQRAGPDLERLQEVQKDADALDDLIANRGLVLEEDVVVERGAYLPGVTVDDLVDMELYGHPWEEKGFTSTFLGDAGGRARSYPALGKWESLGQRYPGTKLFEHQDEVGTAVRFYITLPKGTKVASVEAARRIKHEFPRVQDPIVFEHPEWTADGRTKPEDYTKEDRTQKPTVNAKDLDDKGRRSESEILLGSGARFRVTNVKKGYTYQTGDDSLKPVEVYEVHMEYIGGGSSDGGQH